MGNTESYEETISLEIPYEGVFYRFRNMGNTCFCNSILQSMLFSPNVQYFLESTVEELKDPNVRREIGESSLAQLANIYNLRKSGRKELLLSPTSFLVAVRKEMPFFESNTQHDAHEFFVSILSQFDDTIKRVKEITGKESLPPISKIFQCVRVSSFKCLTCGFVQEIRDTLMCLDITIIPNSNLQNLIDESLCPEDLHDDWECQQCKEKRDAQIFARIGSLPPTLTIQLQRFKYDKEMNAMSKVSEYVEIPEELHLNSGTGPQVYSLRSVVVHHGSSMQRGHFITILKLDNSWIMANDSDLSIINEGSIPRLFGQWKSLVSQPVPYLLFYECKQF